MGKRSRNRGHKISAVRVWSTRRGERRTQETEIRLNGTNHEGGAGSKQRRGTMAGFPNRIHNTPGESGSEKKGLDKGECEKECSSERGKEELG